jgi:hypothetical protein
MAGAFSLRGLTYALFDPVGGNRGEYLMRHARAAWEASLDGEPQRLDRALSAVATQVSSLVAADVALRGGGVSIAAINVLRGTRVHAARLGDAKVFVVRGQEVREAWSGEAALTNPAQVPDVLEVLWPTAVGDTWVLTSSQFVERVPPHAIGEATSRGEDPRTLSAALMATAKSAGGGRQLSVLVVRIGADGVAHEGAAGIS